MSTPRPDADESDRDAHGAWLHALAGLLADLRPTELCLLRLATGDDLRWYEGKPAPQDVIASTGTAQFRGGWLLQLPADQQQPYALFIGSDVGNGVDRAQVMLGAALCRTAWRFARWKSSGGEAAHVDETALAIHTLRNGLNAVVMNAAVLALCPLPERAQGIMHDLESSLQRSLDALQRFALLAR